jgi:ABC-type transport system involved in cytochrome c biogenesis permease subunit
MKKLTLSFLMFMILGSPLTTKAAGGAPLGTSSETSPSAQTQQMAPTPERALADVLALAEKIDPAQIRHLATTQNGRVKPLDTLAREAILFINGSYQRYSVSPVQLYLALSVSRSAPWAPVLEVRDPDLRTKLGYLRDKRFFSAAEIESSPIMNLAQPLFKKQEEGGKLTEEERKITETVNQAGHLNQILGGENFIHSVDFSFLSSGHGKSDSPISRMAQEYLGALEQNPAQAQILVAGFVEQSRKQETPKLFQHYLEKLDTEVFYNDLRPFIWASFLSILFGILLSLDLTRVKFSKKAVFASYVLTLLPLIGGIGLRVYITRFAPVTNMYSTMLWVALGVNVFSLLLFAIYENRLMSGLLLIGSALILMLTEQLPLILSPDLDPLVAVLRSNFWLSTHVTTITISYAAFTIAMVLGNVALVRSLFKKDDSSFIQQYAHYAYRMIQLGCFLLSVGIILGGIWADYSWGRFWGWDPKETWALIADMGFLTLLHARYVGWVRPLTLLAFTPVAYLLVIMAWYGVNFILATGLHSYGFSSGGAMMVSIFVGLQLVVILAAYFKIAKKSETKQHV